MIVTDVKKRISLDEILNMYEFMEDGKLVKNNL